MPPNPVPRGGFKKLAAALERSRDTLIPPAFQVLWDKARVITLYGGRGSGKSWSIARVLISMAIEHSLRILCCREIQGSIKESAYRLLADQIGLLGLDDQFEIQADQIIHRLYGSRFYFEGLRFNDSKIRSYEGVDIVWIEEAQSVSDRSFEVLLPTIRKKGSRIFISFNPLAPDDPVATRFVHNPPPNCISKKVSYLDNPFLSLESEAERAWLERVDLDAYRHVWEGEPRTVSDALILKNKYFAEPFEVQSHWSGPYHGVDFGFSKDPAAAVQLFIDESERVLYVMKEYWQLGVDINRLALELEGAIPGIGSHTVFCDSSRPETISYMQKTGIPLARSAEKWPGSILDGVSYLRSFVKIVVHPTCTRFLDECSRYSYKIDRLTQQPLPEVADAHNHLLDAARYGLSLQIRSIPTSGYFSRAAMFVGGAPQDALPMRPDFITGVLVLSDHHAGGAALVVLAPTPHTELMEPKLTVIDWDILETDQAQSREWLISTFARMDELGRELRVRAGIRMVVEKGDGFGETIGAIAMAHALEVRDPARMLNVGFVDTAKNLPAGLNARAEAARPYINSGSVKIAKTAYDKTLTFRSATTNHFLAQVLRYRADAKEAQELAYALATGVLMANSRYIR